MLEILEETSDKLLACRLQGKHIYEESHKLAGMIDARVAKYGHARCLVEIVGLEGVELRALLEGLEFDLQHTHQIERCAIVGDQPWERWLTRLLKLFFRGAELRFFPLDQRDAALEWVRAD